MIHKGLLRQCQTAKSALLFRSRLTISLASRRPSFLQTVPQPFNDLPPRLCRRHLSTEPNGEGSNKDSPPPAKENGEKETPAEAEDPLREKLEAKEKEIIDLKVWI
jgi:molecular chaperone GrpE